MPPPEIRAVCTEIEQLLAGDLRPTARAKLESIRRSIEVRQIVTPGQRSAIQAIRNGWVPSTSARTYEDFTRRG